MVVVNLHSKCLSKMISFLQSLMDLAGLYFDSNFLLSRF